MLLCSPKWLTFHSHCVWPHCESMCSPNWFGRFCHKVNDVPEVWKIENNHQISIFQSLGCFVEITTRFPFSFLLVVLWKMIQKVCITVGDRLATRSHSQWGHQKLHWKLDSECRPNCTTACENHTMASFWILQNVFQMSFFRYLWPWILLPLCSVQYLSEKKTGMATKSTHPQCWSEDRHSLLIGFTYLQNVSFLKLMCTLVGSFF